ncbi:B3 domain-containing protein Os01g0234100-like isoform X3 [Malania oleifera]|uniref:B3 domain-containing protein Os01g0234100-like isoform X3 n=1 Tax=Malania oleifera TaxID=397392 RepID=UPI0025AE1466|nr:B3 domain-containing protein Os01g0234100-like isoform X3 [Malania oleifera]
MSRWCLVLRVTLRRRNKSGFDGSQSLDKAKSSTMIRAKEVQLNLGTKFPSFVKAMVRSHVSSCFWMGLPVSFCVSYLPKTDTAITLEDDCGTQFETKFIAEKTGLSGGWKRFSVEQKLLEGDVLVFHLVEPSKFKVYIIRTNDLKEVDGALGLLNLDAHSNQQNAEVRTTACKSKKRKYPKSLPLAFVQKKNRRMSQLPPSPSLQQLEESFKNDSEEVDSEVMEGSNFGMPAIQFKDVNRVEDFNILIHGTLIDSELSEQTRTKYYELCCSQNAFLHEHLLKGIKNIDLIAGIISETVNIADAIRACNLSTSRDEFSIWHRTLKAFELLGMNVGFLYARLEQLVTLAFESEGAMDRKRYMDARNERDRTEYWIRNLETKLVKLKQASKKFNADVESLEPRAESHELRFGGEATAPW